MEKNIDMNGFSGFNPYINYDMNVDSNFNDNPMFNPMLQYEQAYMYYRYMSQQMDYKIKCKEYEKLCRNEGSRSERRVE